MRVAKAFLFVALLITSGCLSAFRQKGDKAEVSLAERIFVASKLYASTPVYFAHWQGAPNLNLDDAYKKCINEAIAAPDRFAFDLASIEFLATLHNGHSGFDDDWLNEHYGQSFGFYARPLGDRWVVTESPRRCQRKACLYPAFKDGVCKMHWQDRVSEFSMMPSCAGQMAAEPRARV